MDPTSASIQVLYITPATGSNLSFVIMELNHFGKLQMVNMDHVTTGLTFDNILLPWVCVRQ